LGLDPALYALQSFAPRELVGGIDNNRHLNGTYVNMVISTLNPADKVVLVVIEGIQSPSELAGRPVYEFSGGVDFDRAADACLELLSQTRKVAVQGCP
jgi:hypothetical protein